MAALSNVRWLTRVRPGTRWAEGGRKNRGFVRGFQKKARSSRCKGPRCPRSDLVSVAGGARRSELRGMERSRNIYGSRRFTEPGTLESGFVLAHPSLSPPCRSPAFPLPTSLPLTPTSAPAPSLLAPLTGTRCEGGGCLSCDHAAWRWRGARAHACCQGSVQGE